VTGEEGLGKTALPPLLNTAIVRRMKTLTCDLCDTEFSAETFEEWMAQVNAHYNIAHISTIEDTKDQSQQEAMFWMMRQMERWSEAQDKAVN
tara:strand:+ start:426 stop:701 length:276 start_codon:yes stop_codon:yes gene_type:complete